MVKKAALLCSFFFSFLNDSEAYYLFDKNLEQAYSLIISFRFNEAEAILNREKIEKPGNDLRLLYVNYNEFLKAFISEDIKDFEILKENSERRIRELNKNTSNRESGLHLYTQSEIRIQKAILCFKYNEYLNAVFEIRKVIKLLKENEEQFHGFILNRKVRAFLISLFGTVPEKYQWMMKISSMEGDIMKGELMLRELYNELEGTTYSVYKTEVLVYLGFIYSNFNEPVIQSTMFDEMGKLAHQYPLVALSYSNILMKLGNGETAYNILDASIKSSINNPYYFLYYKRGYARLKKLDVEANNDFVYFLEHHNGTGYIKSAFQKLAWIALLKGDTVAYYREINNCKLKGGRISEEDKIAMEDAVTGELPNIFLLRSRLLFDGGNYDKALSEITGRIIKDFPRHRDQLEVTYRLGRIMQMKKQTGKAIEYFEMTLQNGLKSPYYFAANSSLMLGMIYEEKKDYQKASFYYHKCLTIKDIPYKFSIDQKASAGLNRIKREK